jgi:hypothetical protein
MFGLFPSIPSLQMDLISCSLTINYEVLAEMDIPAGMYKLVNNREG